MKKDKRNGTFLLTVRLLFGTDVFHNVMTAACAVISAVWTVVYAVCLVCRDVMISKAVSDMTLRGAEEYRLIISSPMFTALKILIYLLPIASVLWAVSVSYADKKGRVLCDKKLMIAVLVCIAVAGFVAVIDFAKLHMIF